MPDQPPGDRGVLLACSVRSLRRYWLEVRCGCIRETRIPLRMMPTAAGTLADVLIQLRCRQCGEAPASVALLQDGAAGMHGMIGPPGWRVMLVGGDR